LADGGGGGREAKRETEYVSGGRGKNAETRVDKHRNETSGKRENVSGDGMWGGTGRFTEGFNRAVNLKRRRKEGAAMIYGRILLGRRK